MSMLSDYQIGQIHGQNMLNLFGFNKQPVDTRTPLLRQGMYDALEAAEAYKKAYEEYKDGFEKAVANAVRHKEDKLKLQEELDVAKAEIAAYKEVLSAVEEALKAEGNPLFTETYVGEGGEIRQWQTGQNKGFLKTAIRVLWETTFDAFLRKLGKKNPSNLRDN